jgi:hypothetical protein
MPDIKGTNRAQTLFLRSFRKSPTGPAPENWPSITLLRRWLRKPAFKAALDSIRETLRFHADFQLTIGASQAAQSLRAPDHTALTPDERKKFSDLLRHAHLRQRFPTEPRLASPATFKLRDEIAQIQGYLETLREERQENPPTNPQDQATDQAEERELLDQLHHLKSHLNPPHQGSNP